MGTGAALAWFISFKTRLINKLAEFIPAEEDFSPKPYWDVTRYSWGYGTKAPGSTGTITRDQAFAEMLSHLMSDYDVLRPQITRQLTVNQWTALLSFAYNLGIGNAFKIVGVINTGDDSALAAKWSQYVYAGGKVNSTLVARRQREIDLWNS